MCSNTLTPVKSNSQFRNRHGPLLRLSLLQGALLLTFNNIVEPQLLIIEIQQLEYIFSIVQYARICTLGLTYWVYGQTT
jgi:hypothetical protein